jgi:predicted nucleic acid-binding Zn finger protein
MDILFSMSKNLNLNSKSLKKRENRVCDHNAHNFIFQKNICDCNFFLKKINQYKGKILMIHIIVLFYLT